MSNVINIKEMLNQIKLSEGEAFEYDETAIENEYKKSTTEQSSIAIKILSVCGGILASMAFIGFLMIAGLYESKTGLLFFGFGLIAVSIWINIEFDKLIIDTFSISAYVIGFTLLGMGLGQMQLDSNAICILFIVIALISVIITQNYILSFIAVLIINGSLIFMAIDNDAYPLIHIYIGLLVVLLSYIMLNEAKLITYRKNLSKLYNPLRIGLIISLISGLTFVGKKDLFYFSIEHSWFSSIFTIPVSIYVISVILGIIKTNSLKTKILIFASSFLFLLATAYSPAISGSLLIILLCFLVNYKTGLAIGIIAFIYFISQFYYDLGFTLLIKSIILFSSGVLFLLFYLFTYKNLRKDEEI
ncbi:MAG: DUF4401 domain-containing protein [Bacteroidales bacterium]